MKLLRLLFEIHWSDIQEAVVKEISNIKQTLDVNLDGRWKLEATANESKMAAC